MSAHSRRTFLSLAGAGAAGIAAAALPEAAAGADVSVPSDAPPSMAVFVDDVRAGRLTLMIEGAEVAVVDRKLAALIARAYRRAY